MTPDALHTLARFRSELKAPGFSAGETVGGGITDGILQMPYVSYSPIVTAFVTAAYDHGWLRSDFDWPAWAQSEEAIRLRDDEAALAAASPEQLSALLTVSIRQDRFCEGALLDAFKSSLILRIVRRADALVRQRRTVEVGQPAAASSPATSAAKLSARRHGRAARKTPASER